MQAACRLHYDGMQEVAGCSNLHAGGCRLQQHACSPHAGCMQPALRFKCSRLHWNTRAQSRRRRRVQGVDALHAGCKQAACRASTPRKYAENEHAHSRRIFQSVFFLFLAYDSMLWCHRDVICDARDLQARCVYCLHLAKDSESAGELWCSQFY